MTGSGNTEVDRLYKGGAGWSIADLKKHSKYGKSESFTKAVDSLEAGSSRNPVAQAAKKRDGSRPSNDEMIQQFLDDLKDPPMRRP